MAASHITQCGPEAPTLWSEYVALGGGFSRLLAISSQKPVGGKTLWTSRSKHPSTPQIACLNALKQTETFSHPEAGHPMTRRSAWDSAAHAYKASLPVGLPRIVSSPGTTISTLALTYVTHLDPYRCLLWKLHLALTGHSHAMTSSAQSSRNFSSRKTRGMTTTPLLAMPTLGLLDEQTHVADAPSPGAPACARRFSPRPSLSCGGTWTTCRRC